MPEMKIEQFNFLKENRKHVRGKVTKKCEYITENISTFDQNTCIELLSELNFLQSKLSKVNDDLSKGLWEHIKEKAVLEDEFERQDEYDCKLLQSLNLLNNLNEKLRMSATTSVVNNEHNGPNIDSRRVNKLHLPELPLPKFHNEESESLIQFFNNFENIIDKYSLSNYEKFVFLEKQLFNEALVLVKSLTGSQRSYEEAKDLLIKAFGRPINQKYENIKRLSNLKLDALNPYNFISEVRVIINNFKDLNIDIDMVLQYFIWTSLPKDYQVQYLHITNNNKPNLDQIIEHIFEVTERVDTTSQNKHVVESTSLAANINVGRPKFENKFKPCDLCKKDDHPIYKCKTFDTPALKIKKIKRTSLMY